MSAAVLDGAFRPLAADGLPVFRRDDGAETLFYAPGYLALADARSADDFAAHLLSDEPPRCPAAEALRRHAEAAARAWETRLSRPFAPVCLTLYLNNACNLNCVYCFSQPVADSRRRLDVEAARAAALLVAENCCARQMPLTVVFHGGGEPSLDRRHAGDLLDAVEAAAGAFDLPIFRYIATNGVMSAQKARWLASRFDLIGLSCDGGASIQAAQRPVRGGASSAPFVERTAGIVHQSGGRLHVRVTVTPDTLARQPEIAAYICRELRPEEIHVEPVYQVGRGAGFSPDQADDFVEAFWRARAVAAAYGARWLASGSRPGDLHGPYCQVFRDVLHLVPDGAASACFRLCNDGETRDAGMYIGEGGAGSFTIDHARVGALRRALANDAPACAACFNRYHCVRGCPEACPPDSRAAGGFRCRVQRRLALAYVDETAARLRACKCGGAVIGAPVSQREKTP